MLADFYIPSSSNDLKMAVQKNHLVGQNWYRSLEPAKNRPTHFVLLTKHPNISIFNFLQPKRMDLMELLQSKTLLTKLNDLPV